MFNVYAERKHWMYTLNIFNIYTELIQRIQSAYTLNVYSEHSVYIERICLHMPMFIPMYVNIFDDVNQHIQQRILSIHILWTRVTT